MGDINFTIDKNVDLNKIVNLDIDKDVDVNVNNDDILATAEADAEAFGERALAETDAYTYVNQRGGSTTTVTKPVDVDALGNSVTFDQTGPTAETVDAPITGNVYNLPQNITVDFTNNADIDDLTWTDGLIGNDTIPGSDTPLPLPGEFEADDKLLNYVGLVNVNEQPNVVITARYALLEPWEVDFGTRTVNGDEFTGTGPLSIIVPAGTEYLVEFLDQNNDGIIDAKEYQFDAFPENGGGNWIFDNNMYPIQFYVQDGQEIIETGLSDWAFEATGDFTFEVIEPGVGEAFSYAESTAALDLNGDDNVIPVPTEVL